MAQYVTKSPAALVTRDFHGRFDACGALASLADSDGTTLVVASRLHFVVGPTVCTDDPDAPGPGFVVQDLHVDAHGVRSVLVWPHLRVTRQFRASPEHPLLRVDLLIEPGEQLTSVADVRLPQFRLAEDFLSVIEGDEQDLYFDGAELGGGAELPCWRVFFRRGHRRGLLLATRSRAMMSHLAIWPRTEPVIDCRPHLACNYSFHYDQFNAPLTLSPGRSLRMSLELGPWRRRDHQRLLRLARLREPVQVREPDPRRPPPSHRLKGHVFSAADLATPRATGDGAQADRWMITTEAATRFPRALFANSGYRPPAIKVHPRLKGLHHIFVGVGTGFRAFVKLSGERHRRCRYQAENQPNYLPWATHLQPGGEPREIDFGIADLTGQTIHVGAPYTSQGASVLDYIRFVPLTQAQARARKAMLRRKPAMPLTGFVDTYDIGCFWGDLKMPDTQPYRANLWAHAQAGFQRVFWRIDGECADFPTRTGAMRPVSCWAHGAYEPYAKVYSVMLQRHDLLRAAVQEARRQGLALWGWMRFNSYFSGVRSRFFLEHPEYRDVGERGNVLDFRLNLAEPAVRRHKIDILVEAAGYGLPGLNLGFLRHPPIVCYPPQLVASYRDKFGVEPPRDLTPDYFQHLHTPPESTPEHVRWYRHRAEVMTQFGRELRAALAARKLGHVKISIWVRANHCLFDGIDLDAWLDEGLCDEVVVGPYAGDAKLQVASPAWRRRVQARVPLIGGMNPIGWGMEQDNDVHGEVRRFIRQGYDGLCTYESNDAVITPRMIELYEQLRAGQA
jgi:hypothetical protein